VAKERTFQRGETVPIWAEVRDVDTDALTDASEGAKIVITDPDGTIQVGDPTPVAMDNPDTGKYVYYYTPGAAAVLGWWQTKVKTQDETVDPKYVIEKGGFRLEA